MVGGARAPAAAAPARVLDVGAGTGFLSLLAARLGHRVTAADISAAMVGRIERKAAEAGLSVECVQAPADEPPGGPFDAVMERHLVWTLPDPAAAVAAWRRIAPAGRLLLVESVWGGAAGPLETARHEAREVLRRLRRVPDDHHASYDETLRSSLPLGSGTTPEALLELAASAGFEPLRLERLRDVEWASARSQPLPERLIGVAARFVVVGG